MANINKPKNGFKKGNKLGKGQPKLPPEIKDMKTKTKFELVEIINRLGNKPIDFLEKILEDTKTNVLEGIVASAFIQSIKKGEPHRADILFNRSLGKVPTKTDVNVNPQRVVFVSKEDKKNADAHIKNMIKDK